MGGQSRDRRSLLTGTLLVFLLALLPFKSAVATSQSDPTIFVVNKSSLVISQIFVSSVNATGWGNDWLGAQVLSPGQRFRVAPPRDSGCLFDVRVVYANKQTEERRRQNLCSISELTFTGAAAAAPGGAASGGAAPASNADFEVVNGSRQTIVELYVSLLQAENWGQDRLPGTIAPGAKFEVRLPRGECNYDVRVVYQDRSTEERRRQNLCAITEIAFTGATGTPPAARGTPTPPTGPSFGTGFFVSAQGHALTNHHVVTGCRSIVALIDGRVLPAQLVRRDEQNDLALLRVDAGPFVSFARFRAAPGIRPGEGVIVAGYPLPSVLQNGLNVTVGNVSALAGLGGNTALLQVTAPVQPGNSGGPLLDTDGNVVGVVVSKLDAMRIASATGDIPQNINFAVQGAVARLFVEAGGQRVEERISRLGVPVGDVVDRARVFTFQVECRP